MHPHLGIGFVVTGLLIAAVTWWVWVRRPARHAWWVDQAPGVPVRWAERDRSPTTLGPSRKALAQIPTRTQPPEGVRPAEVGLLLTGRVQRRDLAAAVLELVGNGGLELVPGPDGARRLVAAERAGLSAARERFVVATLQQPQGVPVRSVYADLEEPLRAVAQEIARARTRLWWRPRESAPPWLFLPAGLVAAPALLGSWAFLSIFGLAGIVVLALVTRRRRAGRTAEGTALAIQGLGWRAHLAALGEGTSPSRDHDLDGDFLPWVVAFGLEDAWREQLACPDPDAETADADTVDAGGSSAIRPATVAAALAMTYVGVAGGDHATGGGPIDLCDDLVEGCGGEDVLSAETIVAGGGDIGGHDGDLPGLGDAGSGGAAFDGGGGGFDGGGGGFDGGGGGGGGSE